MKKTQHTPSSEYFDDTANPLQKEMVRLSLEEAELLLFDILRIRTPTKDMRRFAKAQVLKAKSRHRFFDLVVLFSGFMGSLENYYNKDYEIC